MTKMAFSAGGDGGERNHERFNCDPLASSAHSRRQWSQQTQLILASFGQTTGLSLDSRNLQRGQA